MVAFLLRASITSALIFLGVVNGQFLRNITVDDKDISMITYSTGWTTATLADSFAGRYVYASSSSAYATFEFTGVAVYAMMPLFSGYTGGVNSLATLDNGTAQLVNLTRVDSASATSAVRWSETNLSNQTHTLMISLGRSAKGELANWGIVDAFIYTVADPSPVASSASAPTPTSSGVVNLQKCKPCGKSKCAFSADGSPSYDTYRLVVGQPVSNCDPKSTSDVSSQFVKEMDVTETWSVDTTIGVSYAGLEMSATVGWSQSVSRKAGQTVTMSIPPGKMGALTANVHYKKTHGNLRIDSDSFVFNSIQPTDVGGYNVEYADCGKPFSAFTLNSIPGCDSSKSAAYTTRFSLELMSLMGIAVLWNII